MARVRIGLSCSDGHFNYFGDLWEPVKDKDVDKLAERARLPVDCETCGKSLGLAHVEDRGRETEHLARVGGRNIPKPLDSRTAPRAQEGPLSPLEWKTAVFEGQRPRAGAASLCAVSGAPLSFQHDDAHHVLDKRLLRARGLLHLVWDPRNGMFITAAVHGGHTSRMAPITRDKIPEAAWQFAREVGPWAVARLESDYPQRKDT